VAGKDAARNALVAVQGHDHPLLYRTEVDVVDMHWIAGAAPTLATRFGAKTRYRMADAACEIGPPHDGRSRAVFTAPQWAPTPGQYLVLYDGEICLGGGVIDSRDDAGTTGHSEESALSYGEPALYND
jgi:tRNA-specific 2-thiouridylase